MVDNKVWEYWYRRDIKIAESVMMGIKGDNPIRQMYAEKIKDLREKIANLKVA